MGKTLAAEAVEPKFIPSTKPAARRAGLGSQHWGHRNRRNLGVCCLAGSKLNGWSSLTFRERPYLTEQHQERWRKMSAVNIYAHTCIPALLHRAHMDTHVTHRVIFCGLSLPPHTVSSLGPQRLHSRPAR